MIFQMSLWVTLLGTMEIVCSESTNFTNLAKILFKNRAVILEASTQEMIIMYSQEKTKNSIYQKHQTQFSTIIFINPLHIKAFFVGRESLLQTCLLIMVMNGQNCSNYIIQALIITNIWSSIPKIFTQVNYRERILSG